MQVRRIVTEDAYAEQWRMLLHFSYEPNIRRFLVARGHPPPTKELEEFIAGSLRQGEAYFTAAQNAPLDISPLLLYYGLTNLMVSAAALTMGVKPPISSHGMRLEIPQTVRDTVEAPPEEAAESETQTDEQLNSPVDAQTRTGSQDGATHDSEEEQEEEPVEVDSVTPPDHIPTGLAALRVVPHSPNDGGLSILAGVFSPGTTFRMNQPWSLEELLGSVPDLREEFIACYPDAACYVLPVELMRRRYATFERVNLAHVKSYSRLISGIERIEMFLRLIDGFNDAYLPPQRAHDSVPLRRKLDGRDIGVYGMFGHKFLALPHIVDRDPNAQVSLDKMHTPSPLIVLLMSLYALGFVSRYRPELWNPFVRNDTTGEKMVVERLLFIAARYAPNLVLNVIHGERLSFVPPTQELGDMLEEHALTSKGIRDGRASVGNHAPLGWSENELQAWVKDIVNDMLRRMERNG